MTANSKSYRVFIPGRLPGENEIIKAAKSGRGKGNAYGRMKATFGARIAEMIREAGVPFLGAVFVNIVYVEKNRRRDKDNIDAGKKFIFDALQAAGVIKNDGWSELAGWRSNFAVDKHSPGVWLTIFPRSRRETKTI